MAALLGTRSYDEFLAESLLDYRLCEFGHVAAGLLFLRGHASTYEHRLGRVVRFKLYQYPVRRPH